MRTRWLYAATAVLLLSVAAPGRAQSHVPDRATVLALAKQVWSAGTWDEQRVAFERLPERERTMVWLVLTDVRPVEKCCG